MNLNPVNFFSNVLLSSDPYLNALQGPLADLISRLMQASSFPSWYDLSQSQLIYEIAQLIPTVIADLEALKNGDSTDRAAYKNCLPILDLLTSGSPSIEDACTNYNPVTLAQLIWPVLKGSEGLYALMKTFYTKWYP